MLKSVGLGVGIALRPVSSLQWPLEVNQLNVAKAIRMTFTKCITTLSAALRDDWQEGSRTAVQAGIFDICCLIEAKSRSHRVLDSYPAISHPGPGRMRRVFHR